MDRDQMQDYINQNDFTLLVSQSVGTFFSDPSGSLNINSLNEEESVKKVNEKKIEGGAP